MKMMNNRRMLREILLHFDMNILCRKGLPRMDYSRLDDHYPEGKKRLKERGGERGEGPVGVVPDWDTPADRLLEIL